MLIIGLKLNKYEYFTPTTLKFVGHLQIQFIRIKIQNCLFFDKKYMVIHNQNTLKQLFGMISIFVFSFVMK